MENQETNKETEGEKQDAPVTTEDAGDTPKAPSLIEGANAASERLEKNIEALKAQNDRTEEIAAQIKLSPTAGGHIAPEKKVESALEYANEFAKGNRGNPFQDIENEIRE